MRSKKLSYSLAFEIIIAMCCLGWGVFNLLPHIVTYYHTLVPTSRCTSYKPPTGFEVNLIGTWVAGSPDYSDTLTLRNDHTYKQSVHRDGNKYYPAVDYKSDWQTWWIEYKSDGIPYLHLAGMRLCGVYPWLNCDHSGGTGYDFCSDKGVPMNDEGILLILGAEKSANMSSHQEMNLFFPEGSEDTWVYTLQKP